MRRERRQEERAASQKLKDRIQSLFQKIIIFADENVFAD